MVDLREVLGSTTLKRSRSIRTCKSGFQVPHPFWHLSRLLSKEGHDIESHGMEHRYLLNLSSPRSLSRIRLEDQNNV